MNTEISRIHFEAEYLKRIHCEFEADSKLFLQRNEDGRDVCYTERIECAF